MKDNILPIGYRLMFEVGTKPAKGWVVRETSVAIETHDHQGNIFYVTGDIHEKVKEDE